MRTTFEEFRGAKFVCVCEHEIPDPNAGWWEKDKTIVKSEFLPTRRYRRYLYEKQKFERELELKNMKAKLETCYRLYGEVDDIDFQEYLYKMKEYELSYGEKLK